VGGAVLDDNIVRVQEALDASRERERSLELEASSWQLLRDVLREAENEEGNQLGRALSGPVTARLRALTASRYGNVLIGPTLQALGIDGVLGAPAESVLAALSVGTKDQLATLLRMTVAQELCAPIILDDHLVHTDPERLTWFRRALRETAALTQVIVLTCRPQDYLAADEIPAGGDPARDLAGGALRAVDLGRVVRRWSS
jgi:DNA repair protein SbcC/Rad50